MQPFALFIRGPSAVIFELSDRMGFESPMDALAVSIFEDSPDNMHVQALYETRQIAETALSALGLSGDVEAFITQLDDEDWVSKSQQGLPPVDAGRFWIYGSHDAKSVPKDVPWPILVDAGQAFGTGHHGTTKGCLLIFDQLLNEKFDPKTILDLGCGAGVLAIAAAKALKRPVLATDIDPDAILVTDQNAQINDVSQYIESAVADGFDSPQIVGKTFDLIFANILAGPLMGLAPKIAQALKPGGRVILSGILDEQASTVSAAFEKAGINTVPQPSISGWTSLLGHKKTQL